MNGARDAPRSSSPSGCAPGANAGATSCCGSVARTGLDASLRSDADETLRLSDLTLPHALARVLLAEALYRAWSLTAGHPYHRA